jgi:hypothetical protein
MLIDNVYKMAAMDVTTDSTVRWYSNINKGYFFGQQTCKYYKIIKNQTYKFLEEANNIMFLMNIGKLHSTSEKVSPFTDSQDMTLKKAKEMFSTVPGMK